MSEAWVYVIGLSPKAVKRRHDRALVARGGAVVYVGQSQHSPQRRFQDHLHGGVFASSIVTRYGTHLIGHEGPHPDRASAERAEKRLTTILKNRGNVVLGRH